MPRALNTSTVVYPVVHRGRHVEVAMRLNEALKLARRATSGKRWRKIALVCGFQPLHLETFIRGYFARRFPEEMAEVRYGLFGDLGGNVEMATDTDSEGAAVIVEWGDLDPRLGLRSAGGWRGSLQDDILRTVSDGLSSLLSSLHPLAGRMPVALIPPTIPASFLGHTAGRQWSANEAELGRLLATFLSEAAKIGGVSVASPDYLARYSPESERLDATLLLEAGCPYTIRHAAVIGAQAVNLLFPPAPMKGLITDLDDTLWAGILGEVGVEGVGWTLSDRAAGHGLYQQMLAHLSEMGVLLSVASKNEAPLVKEALARKDLLVGGDRFYPVCVGWERKSESVARILRGWNIGPESVVFVDDSLMELEEVRNAYPTIRCLQYPRRDPEKLVALLAELRDLFGKATVGLEDSLRQASIRSNAAIKAGTKVGSADEFLLGLRGQLTFDCRKEPGNRRQLELLNKTNQFNLNGRRINEAEWQKQLINDDTIVVSVSYEDKFGPLGTIGVLVGHFGDSVLDVFSWVLSCRAFSRRIEHHMLSHIFDVHDVRAIQFDFLPTERNQPLRNYLTSLGIDSQTGGSKLLERDQFYRYCLKLPHHISHQSS